MATDTSAPAPETEPVSIKGATVRLGDRVFSSLSKISGILVLAIMAAIAIFLIWRAIPSFSNNTENFLTFQQWFPDDPEPKFGIAALLFGTIISSIIALILAVPVGVGIALFITFYARKRFADPFRYVIDLLAAVPSIIFGLWGLEWLMPRMQPLLQWMDDKLGFIPLFENRLDIYTKSIFIASVVLAIMILPTVAAISREVFAQVPSGHVEAALALGATRWEMVRMAVLPFGRPGVISASMLGLGRALGETIAVALLLSAAFEINWRITEPGGNTFAANIALKWNEAGSNGLSALVASGLVLFVITLVVNMSARIVIARRADFSGAN